MSNSHLSRRLELFKVLLGSKSLPNATELSSGAGISYNRATELLLAVALSTGEENFVAKTDDFAAFEQLCKSGTVPEAYSKKRAVQLKGVREILENYESASNSQKTTSCAEETGAERDETPRQKNHRVMEDNELYFDYLNERFERIADVTDTIMESVQDVAEKRRKKPKSLKSTLRAAGFLESDMHEVATSIAREHHRQFDRMRFESYTENSEGGLPTPWNELELGKSRIHRLSQVKDTVVVGDIHFPYYSRRSLELLIEEITRRNIKRMIILGDLTDMYALSKYPKKRRLQHFKPELDATRQGIDAFGAILRSLGIQVIVVLGNHDARFMAYLLCGAPELAEVDVFSYASLLRLKENGFEVIDNESVFVETGGVILTHGDKVRLGSGRTLGEKVFRTYNKTAIHAHSHQVSTFLADRTGRSCVGGYSIGNLSSLEVDYNLLNPYMHGACFMLAEDNGTDLKYRIENCVLYNGKFCPQFSF